MSHYFKFIKRNVLSCTLTVLNCTIELNTNKYEVSFYEVRLLIGKLKTVFLVALN